MSPLRAQDSSEAHRTLPWEDLLPKVMPRRFGGGFSLPLAMLQCRAGFLDPDWLLPMAHLALRDGMLGQRVAERLAMVRQLDISEMGHLRGMNNEVSLRLFPALESLAFSTVGAAAPDDLRLPAFLTSLRIENAGFDFHINVEEGIWPSVLSLTGLRELDIGAYTLDPEVSLTHLYKLRRLSCFSIEPDTLLPSGLEDLQILEIDSLEEADDCLSFLLPLAPTLTRLAIPADTLFDPTSIEAFPEEAMDVLLQLTCLRELEVLQVCRVDQVLPHLPHLTKLHLHLPPAVGDCWKPADVADMLQQSQPGSAHEVHADLRGMEGADGGLGDLRLLPYITDVRGSLPEASEDLFAARLTSLALTDDIVPNLGRLSALRSLRMSKCLLEQRLPAGITFLSTKGIQPGTLGACIGLQRLLLADPIDTALLAELPHTLTELSLEGIRGPGEPALGHLTSLETLFIRCGSEDGWTTCDLLALTRLAYLVIRGSFWQDGKREPRLQLAGHRSLRSVHVQDEKPDEDLVDLLCSLPALTSLHICPYYNDEEEDLCLTLAAARHLLRPRLLSDLKLPHRLMIERATFRILQRLYPEHGISLHSEEGASIVEHCASGTMSFQPKNYEIKFI